MSGNAYVDGLWIGPWASVTACNDDTPFVAGQVGKISTIQKDVNKNPQPLYMYVQRQGSDTASNVAGAIMTWVTATSAVVGIGNTSRVPCGVFLGDDDQTDLTLKGMQSGKYGFVQVAGIASCIASTTDSCATVGLPVVFNTTGQVLTMPSTTSTALPAMLALSVGTLLSTTTAQNGAVSVLLSFPMINNQ